MKNVYPFILLLIVAVFSGCKKDVAYADELSRSKEVYMAFKAASNNSYTYVVTTASWVGYRTATTLTVKEGKVVGRSYIAKQRTNTAIEEMVVGEWTEDAGSLGKHTDGAALQNLDDVYEKAKNEWLKKRDDADVYFEAKNSGMISSAGFTEKNCADDCFRGIEISSITKL